jgi:hypothetical protein
MVTTKVEALQNQISQRLPLSNELTSGAADNEVGFNAGCWHTRLLAAI